MSEHFTDDISNFEVGQKYFYWPDGSFRDTPIFKDHEQNAYKIISVNRQTNTIIIRNENPIKEL